MCLDIIFANNLEDQVGYKVFKKIDGKIHGCVYPNPHKGRYPIRKWIIDNCDKIIYISEKLSYKTGFHIYSDLDSAIQQKKCSFGDCCIFKVKYRKIVSIGAQDPSLKQDSRYAKPVIVAREMMLLKEIKNDI